MSVWGSGFLVVCMVPYLRTCVCDCVLRCCSKAFDEDPKIVALKASDQWYK